MERLDTSLLCCDLADSKFIITQLGNRLVVVIQYHSTTDGPLSLLWVQAGRCLAEEDIQCSLSGICVDA